MSSPNTLKEVTIDWVAVGRRIRALRGFDINQVEFGHLIGVVQSHVSAMERGQREIGVTVLLKIANWSGKSIEWLLTGSDSKTE